ncbi:MAG: hypothetical protein HC777_00895 [Hyphomonadaceae bacterium]|nr:hypothetical protein [Hyphomonadaceae bacterium]
MTYNFLPPCLIAITLVASAFVGPSALAQSGNVVSLKANPTPSGTQITLGDIFNNAGPAASRPLARTPNVGQRVVFGAPSLQARAQAAGLRWPNAEGVREVVVQGTARASSSNTQIPVSNVPDAPPATLAVLSRGVHVGKKSKPATSRP